MEQLPFVNSKTESALLKEFYPSAPIVRVSLDSLPKLADDLAPTHLWIDPGIDGFHQSSRRSAWNDYIGSYTAVRLLDDPSFIAKPDKALVRNIVWELLDRCIRAKASRISVPQLPFTNDTSRNKINRELATAVGEWRREKQLRCKFVLPVIFTHSKQLTLKANRLQKTRSVNSALERSGAEFVWVVDSSLQDQSGSSALQKSRFPSIIALHQELKESLPPKVVTLAGPYWGINLVLWARGLVDIPIIGLGGSYQYHLTGGPIRESNARIALAPLRRWAVVSADLRDWLELASASLAEGDAARQAFALTHNDFKRLQSKIAARRQLTEFYKAWCSKISALPMAGRGLGLYQDLSSAYVIGKALEDLPKSEGSARQPERVAQQLMLSCL